MVTEELAKMLKKGDIVHFCLTPGKKCEEFRVIVPYTIYDRDEDGTHCTPYWSVELQSIEESSNTYSGISSLRTKEWHLPGECPPPSRQLAVSVHRVWDDKKVGVFLITLDDSEESLKRNILDLIQGIQILAREGFPEGYQ